MKVLLAVEAYYMSEQDLYDMREPVKNFRSHHFFEKLPDWVVRVDTGEMDWSDSYLQFCGTENGVDGEQYILFDAMPLDPLFAEEVSNSGLNDLIQDYDWRPLFKKLYINEAPTKRLAIPMLQYVVLEMKYTGKYEDVELDVEIVGYLDEKMNLCKI